MDCTSFDKKMQLEKTMGIEKELDGKLKGKI